MTDDTLGIGELARLTGVSVRTIRFYCDEGILTVRRSSGGHRRFDPSAVENVRLIRRLRRLGLGLPSIVEVLTGERSLDEVIAIERSAVDAELSVLAWRRASLAAVAEVSPAERAARLELLAHAQGPGARDALEAFWLRMVQAPIRPELADGLIAAFVPPAPAEPTPAQVVAFAEMVTLTCDDALIARMRARGRVNMGNISDEDTLMVGVGEACRVVTPCLLAGEAPRPGPELDDFVAVHAEVRGARGDTPEFRRYLQRELTLDQQPQIDRYWELVSQVTGQALTLGATHRWLLDSLAVEAA
ncbi:MerR family transcriptional regulator [Actinomadura barringtoniae]|uniref:MerR family transcriptional regulator n=1 Tax=Actinomadura barringtoniae TaxID=1427535 RepID=A0A939TC11_9ACTN|nr:MerR family transcriptional regulator [Actinomadura barringtoniae]MBO2450760.1 MerR family transcriptional regulator [Actinomadura barringtoniae]